MDEPAPTDVETLPMLEVRAARPQRLPLVLASPHSGRDYPQSFLAVSRLDGLALRKSEDSFVDEIFSPAGLAHGVPLLRALFPRAFVDPNREAFELDPAMFEDVLPPYVNTRSARVAAGLGTVAKVVAQGQDIYRCRLPFSEALDRINRCYLPYHAELRQLIVKTLSRFGVCFLLDCHSMPSGGGAGDSIGASGACDFVLGDCHGRSCSPPLIEAAESWLAQHGYSTARNVPYAGGYTTRHYGRPHRRVHALQIEINRALYMNEGSMTRKPFINSLAEDMAELVAFLGRLDLASR